MVPSVLLVAASVLAIGTAIFPPCRFPCRGDHCDVEPEGCEYGPEWVCGRKVCAKGPGERCGGYQNVHGKCGAGLTCDNCGFCMGCYQSSILDTKIKCYHSDSSKCFANGL